MVDPEKQAIWGEGVWGDFNWAVVDTSFGLPSANLLISTTSPENLQITLGAGTFAQPNFLTVSSFEVEIEAKANLTTPSTEIIFSLNSVDTRSINRVMPLIVPPVLVTANDVEAQAPSTVELDAFNPLTFTTNELDFSLGVGFVLTPSNINFTLGEIEIEGKANLTLPQGNVIFNSYQVDVDTVNFDFNVIRQNYSRRRSVQVEIRNPYSLNKVPLAS